MPFYLIERYMTHVNDHHVAITGKAECKRWLLYFYDFSAKYQVSGTDHERLGLFLAKLREKKQPQEERRKAARAISLYFDMLHCEQCNGAAVLDACGRDG